MDNTTNTKKKIWDSKVLWVIISILASILLWVYVTTTQGDITEARIENVPVVFSGQDTIREKDGLVITDISSETITVVVRGTRRDISKLSSSNIVASIDVSKIAAASQHTSTVDITFPSSVNDSTTSVVSTVPSTISFSVVKENSKTIEIRGEFTGTLAEGYAAKDPVIDPSTVVISGPESEISQVSYAKIVINRTDVDKTLTFDSDYILCDDEGNEVEQGNIELETEIVSVTLPISATKEVPLTVDLIEGAGATSENVKITCDPETITIAGDAETLDGISKISLGTVDLTSFASTFEDTFSIVLDNDVTNVTGQTQAKVTIQIIGLATKQFNVTNISYINAAEGRTVTIITENIVVTLRGEESVLREIQANNIRAVVDLSEITASTGEFQPNAKITVDGFTGVGAIRDYPVYIKIT